MLVPLLLVLSVNACISYKILVVNPKFGYSHMNFMGKIADTLVDAGHEVSYSSLELPINHYPSREEVPFVYNHSLGLDASLGLPRVRNQSETFSWVCFAVKST
ncbi:hypothetical protein Y032_0123g1156 [Ancylostoma ceylanicum]|uniref:Glucuronosyltransferase n=1 Tax=Ancylostoma ceylanicum TaxID=53326 RepID=A0A016T9L2_9BILA|nr:hypothetical protein Y032_0123g1156 [Ancylostoma ceylanicum]